MPLVQRAYARGVLGGGGQHGVPQGRVRGGDEGAPFRIRGERCAAPGRTGSMALRAGAHPEAERAGAGERACVPVAAGSGAGGHAGGYGDLAGIAWYYSNSGSNMRPVIQTSRSTHAAGLRTGLARHAG